MLNVNINFLWAAITLSCIALAFIIVGGIEDIDWSKYISLIFGLVALVFWIIVLLLQLADSNKNKYQTLLNRQTQAERNVEKYLIDHPELRVLEIDENGQIVKVDK
jgi:Na+(H+)/acetate symporter ActP